MAHRLGIHHTVSRNTILRNFHEGEHRSAVELVHIQQLPQGGNVGVDHIVGKNYRERFVADEFARPQHGVPQAQRFLLPHIGDIDHVRDGAYGGQQILLVARFEQVLQLEAHIEMIFDRGLAAAGDDDDVLDSGMNCFLHSVLDQRLIHQREHFLRLGLGGGEETGAKPRGRKDGLANLCVHQLTYSTDCSAGVRRYGALSA